MTNRREYRQPKELNIVFRLIVIIVASFIFALNLKTFVHTGGLLPGGASGLTLLLQEVFLKFFNIKTSYTIINVLINAIPVYIGFKYIGRRFTELSCAVILLTGVFTDILPAYTVTKDILLISVFGGIISGAAISMCLLVDATSGGIDFITIYLSEKRGVDSFNIALGVNSVILCLAGILFSWDKALYSIIFQYASTMTIRILYRKYQQSTLFIVTTKPEEICNTIYELTHHGATIIEGEGSYEHSLKKVLYSVVSTHEVGEIVSAIQEIEPDAFVNVLRTERLSGRFYRVPKD